jgi:type VI secretion system protein ImpH
MASPNRRQDAPLAETLFEEPFRFEFFQAVRLLEQLDGGRVPVGHDGPPGREVVRFVGHLAMDFPASAIHSLDRPPTADDDGPGRPPRMETPFMGLIGTLGALPTIYTETLVLMSSRGRAAAVDFLDQFHHRLVSLFYRAWQKYHIAALWEQGQASRGKGRAGDDPFTRRIFDLIGLGLEPLRDRQAFPDHSLLFYAGLFAQQHRSAVSLEALLRDYFGHPASVATFAGQWLRLAPEQRSRMGRLGAYNRLGVDTVAGHKAWDVQSHFRVRIGPLRFAEFVEFLPGGAAFEALADLVRLYVRAELDFDVQPILRADEVPWCRASRGQGGSRLGRTSWLKCKEFARDAEDAVFLARR